MNKKFLSILSILVIFIFGLMGCNNSKMQNINKKKVIVATSGTYYPFTFMEGNNLKGFEIDLWNEIGNRLNYDVEFKTASFSGIFGMLESKKADTIANEITITDERRDKYAFSEPYVYSGAQIIVRDDDNSINNFEDLKGKKVGVDLGSNYEKIVKDKDINNSIKVVTYQNTDAAFNELLLGRIDAVVIDKISALVAINEKNLALKLAGQPIDTIENAYVFNKENTDLVNEVNVALNDIKEDGTLQKISEKWLHGNITIPGDDNINLHKNNNENNRFKFDFMYSLKLIPILIGALKITIS
ncbi:MAG: amino acid ABC transporter substrate-binding protein, partial [Sarcina sp.]